MLMAFAVTVVLCRVRLSRKKRVSIGTLFAGASSVPLLGIILGTCVDPTGFWSTRDKGPGVFGILILAALFVVVCSLPAGAVVVYYQRRSKRDEKQVV